MSEYFMATASATATSTASATATATGATIEEALANANESALTSAYCSLVTLKHPPSSQHTCTNFCLSCIDFRFVNDVTYYESVNGYANNFDNFILAGTSLGYNGIPNYENWILCCDQTIELSRDLHEITEISIFDHLDCSAYGLVYTPEELEGDGEFKLHVENLNKAEATLLEKYSFITKVNKFIIDLDFKVIPIP